ncbi:MAG: DUF2796 domain-containing protein [Rhodocyclaceae bacterium]
MKHRLLPLVLACTTSLALAQHKHVHGEGQLDVAIDAGRIELILELPLDAAVGFERPPRNEKEKTALAAAAAALDAVPFLPAAAARCALETKHVHVPFLGGDDRRDRHAHEGETHHADIEAHYGFRCAQPAALKSVETTLFQSFKRLYRLEVQRNGPAGQGKHRLTPKVPVLSW